MTSGPTDTSSSRPVITRRTACRACRGATLTKFLSLGEVPLANSFLTAGQLQQPEPRFPLEVYFCADCSLVQLVDVVDPAVLFSHYLYRSGTSSTLAQHNAALAETVARERGLTSSDLVVEIASNDGSLLKYFCERHIRVLGVEPATNIAALAREAGVETLNEFFNATLAEKILSTHGAAGVIIANNVLAHVDTSLEFLEAARSLLKADGRIVIEVPYLAEMLAQLEYDTIYHEHLSYFSVTALLRLFTEAGLALDRVDLVPIHGGSLRLWAKQIGAGGHTESVLQLAEKERAAGLARLATYQEFGRRVARNRKDLLALLRQLQGEGKSLAGYGAPAKGNTLLCYCGIGTDIVPYTVDRSPLKVGLFCPGSHIPIEPFDRILERRPDYVLILAWNFATEIMASLSDYQEKGGQFILPIPFPAIL